MHLLTTLLPNPPSAGRDREFFAFTASLFSILPYFRLSIYILIFAFWLLPAPLAAFHGSIEGMVSDSERKPLIGAQIWLEGHSIGTATDTFGRYYIEVPSHGEFRVVYQFIGYKSETLTVFVNHGERATRNVQLRETALPAPTVEIRGRREMVHESRTPEPTVIIPKAVAEQAGKSTIGEAATTETGIQLQKRCSACEASELSIHGLPGRFSLILLEGTPVFSNLASRYILDILPVDFIDRLEVVKGASGAIWGSDAVAGAVNILLPQPVRRLEGKANYTKRSFGNDLSAMLGSNLKTLGISIISAHSNREFVDLNQDTIAENTAFRRDIILTNLNYYPGLNWRLNTGGSFADELRRAGAIIADSGYGTNPLAEKVHTRRWDLWQRTQLTINEKELLLRLAISEHRENGVVETRDYSARQTTLYSEFSANLSYFTSGISFTHQLLTDIRLFEQGYTENNLAFWTSGKNISPPFLRFSTEILPALRVDLNSEYGVILSPYGSVKLYPGFLDLNFAAGTGFRTPTVLFESMEYLPNGYQYAIRRDPRLVRESGLSLQAGATKRVIGQGFISDIRLNLFWHRVSDFITAEFTGLDTLTRRAIFYYHNLDELVFSTGAEFSINLVLPKNISATLNAYTISPRSSSVQPLPFIRRWGGNYILAYKIPHWQVELNLAGEVNGPMLVQAVYGNNHRQDYDSPVYSILNLRATKELAIFRLGFGVNNLWDYHQPPISHQEGKTEYYWGPIIGREFWTTVSINI